MASAKFYTFSKRKNSTKRPSVNAGTTVSIKLKNSCSYLNPTFIVNTFTPTWNYVKFEGDYYYIDDVTIMTNDLVEVTCSKDVLASHVTEIGNTTAYVQYGTSDYNTMVTDERITASTSEHVLMSTYTTGTNPDIFDDTRCFATIILNGDNELATVGAANGYQVDAGELQRLCDMMMSNQDGLWVQIDGYLNRPFDAFISTMYMPVRMSYDTNNYMPSATVQSSSTKATLRLGMMNAYTMVGGDPSYINGVPLWLNAFSVTTADNKASAPTRTRKYWSVEVPKHYGDFRDLPPYSRYAMYLPFLGYIDLDMTKFELDTKILVEAFIDFIGGTITYRLAGNNSLYLDYYTVNVGIDIPISQIKSNKVESILNSVMGIGTVTAGAISAGALTAPLIAGGIGAIAKGVIDYNRPTLNNMGGVGDFAKCWQVLGSASDSPNRMVHLKQFYKDTTQNPNAQSFIDTQGRPVYAMKTINTLSGYIKCQNASVECDGYESEKDLINTYLNGGFFYE